MRQASYDSVAGVPLKLVWRVKNHIMYLWEIDTEALAHVIPERLELMEVRPGRSIMTVECLQYHTDHFSPGYREFGELVVAAQVQPDLSLKMPTPRFAMHAITVYSDSQEFVNQEGTMLFTPTKLSPKLEINFSADGTSAAAHDEDGPILDFRNTHPKPEYYPNELWGQYYTDAKGLQRGVWEWDGEMFEHMHGGDAGKVFAHPFYKGIDVSRIRGCYRQMMAKAGQSCAVRFYHIGLL